MHQISRTLPFALLAFAASIAAQESRPSGAASITGTWSGRLEATKGTPIPPQGLPFRMTIEASEAGLQGTFDLGIQATSIENLTFEQNRISGEMTLMGFKGGIDFEFEKDRFSGKVTSFVTVAATGNRTGADEDTPELGAWLGSETTFSEQDIEQFDGRHTIVIPEVFELVNIGYALTESGQAHPWMLRKGTDYLQEVLDAFEPHRSHPLIAKLDSKVEADYGNYFEERDNAFGLEFADDGSIRPNNYGRLHGRRTIEADHELWEDFASTSGFRDFYAAHRAFYDAEVERFDEQVPVLAMWKWLENRFPSQRYNSYRIVFSPLLGASHATTNVENRGFRECIMFVSGPRTNSTNTRFTEAMRSRVLFTEIDHNYVNPATRGHRDAIERAMPDLEAWNDGAQGYPTPFRTFNEYLTFGVHALFVRDRYTPGIADMSRHDRCRLMVEHRGFVRYAEFEDALIRAADELEAEESFEDLVEPMIEWVRKQSLR